jgi:hypothetical protein
MGNDLYWKQTPKPVEEEHHGLSMATWGRLATIWQKEMEDMSGIEITRDDLKELEVIHNTAIAIGGEAEFTSEIHDLIEGVRKYDSITLVILG